MSDTALINRIGARQITVQGAELCFRFEINRDCSLLDEHFPGFPIAPASLVLSFVFDELSALVPINHDRLDLRATRFSKPITPGHSYRCSVRADALDATQSLVRFTVVGEALDVHVRGSLVTSASQPNLPPELRSVRSAAHRNVACGSSLAGRQENPPITQEPLVC